jgi:hypothetical protein
MKKEHAFLSLFFQNHDGVMVQTPLIGVFLSTELYFLAWAMTKSSFSDSFNLTKKRRSGLKSLGGKQNVNQSLLVDIQFDTSSTDCVKKPMLEEGPQDGSMTEICGLSPFAV